MSSRLKFSLGAFALLWSRSAGDAGKPARRSRCAARTLLSPSGLVHAPEGPAADTVPEGLPDRWTARRRTPAAPAAPTAAVARAWRRVRRKAAELMTASLWAPAENSR